MPLELARLESIFSEALAQSTPAERDAFIDQACGSDPELRGRIERLLAAHETAQSFMAPPDPDRTAEPHIPIHEKPGSKIGRYKLLEQIGEGGFGVVFMAEQEQPVRRRVALKVIKLGMDTKQVVARFEAERQALAMMDHPNIAKVLDGGSTDSGRPYFVMELVKGIPITEYCDQQELSTRDRLELFVDVCKAVQHAHQRGVIHRDIKPSNVLLTLHDDQAVPKVIDFGIAKATQARLTEMTLFTEFRQLIGTPAYMSPEQAQMTGLDVDTRSDIYSLGVMLYELLTGSTPFDSRQLSGGGLDEMRRIIREVEPPPPSSRLSTLGAERLGIVAHQRHCDPQRLGRLVQGDLDWIVMRCLEKDRARRYDTAVGLAEDIQRHLTHEPVQARLPTAGYRFRKFARRNKGALAVGALVLFFLVLLGSGIGWTVRDRTVRQAKVSGQLELILDEVARLEQAEKWSEALVSARRAEPALATGEASPDVQERARQALADLELVRRLEETRMGSGTALGDAAGLRQNLSVRAEQEYTAALRQAGIDLDALPLKDAVDRITARRAIAAALLPALDDWVAVRSVGKDEAATRRLIDVLRTADPDPWRQRVRDALVRKDWPALENLARSADLDRQPAATLTFLCAGLHTNRHWLAIEVLRRAQWKYPADYWINFVLGMSLIYPGKEDVVEGMGYMRTAIALRPEVAHPVMILGIGYVRLKRYDEGIACYQKAIELKPDCGDAYCNIALALKKKGRHVEAVPYYRKALELAPQDALIHNNLAYFLANSPDTKLRDPDEAVKMAKRAVELSPNEGGYWNTLGAAQYRAGDWRGAIDTLKKSEKLQPGRETGSAASFLAMAHWQLGEQDEARGWYGQAVEWIEKKKRLDDEELRRLQVEVEELLKITSADAKLRYEAVKMANYRKALELAPQDASLHNDLAWLLTTSADAKLRDPDEAVKMAKKAVELAPKQELYWNTLGAAQFRAGDWRGAIEALKKSEELKPGRFASFNAFVLAMAHWQLGNQDEARQWYGHAVEWMEKQDWLRDNENLRRFRAEAEELLKITDQKPTTKPESK